MAYYFMSEITKGKYRPINISNSKYFQDYTRRYNKPCAYSLEEIDRFTMMFDNEIELRERLVEEGTLPFSLFEKPLSIRNVNKNEYNKVPYEFLYQQDIEYIMDPTLLVEKIMRRFYEGDFLLIKKIVNRFSEDHRCRSTAPEVRQLIEMSIREGKINHHFDDLDENQDKLLVRLIKLIILESYDTKYGKLKYQDKVRYRNLHVLIALINYYDKEEIKTDAPIFKSESISQSNTQAPTFTTEIVKELPQRDYQFVRTKTLGKKKHTLDEQIGFNI